MTSYKALNALTDFGKKAEKTQLQSIFIGQAGLDNGYRRT
jgi:Ran GTPase-activating protein (RanGAP) involved in mRNA processing and transport